MLLAKRKRPRERSELEQEAKQAQEVLFQATTVFPFVLFPDTLTIDRVKVTIAHRLFFATAQVTSIQIEDILNVASTVGPFFGSIKIWSHVFRDRTLDTRHLEIDYLTRRNALEAERLIQGYIIARHKEISTSDISKTHLLKLLRQLGQNGSA
jgi:hypothetical protein